MNELSLSEASPADPPDPDAPHPLLKWSDERLGLGVPVMDGYHQEFLSILTALTTMPDGVFVALLKELVRHTHEHFSQEEKLMRETGYAALQEHLDEHRRVLGELEAMLARAERGRMRMPREFIKNHMPEWFQLHLVTMDSSLAQHLKIKLNLD